MIYLDYQATTPVAPEVAAAMLPWIEEKFANPHSPSRWGSEAAAAIEFARKQVERRSVSQGGQRRLHRQRDRGAELGAQGHDREAPAAATGSSPWRPSMPRCSTAANGSRAGASRSCDCRSARTVWSI